MACDIRAGFLLRHRWLCSYGELQNAPSLMPQTHINIPAFFVSCKQLYSLALVAVHLPAAGAFEIVSRILNETDHIAERIIEEKPDLMGKSFLPGKAFLQMRKCRIHIHQISGYLISIPCKKSHHARLLQILFQTCFPAHIHQCLRFMSAQQHNADPFSLSLIHI